MNNEEELLIHVPDGYQDWFTSTDNNIAMATDVPTYSWSGNTYDNVGYYELRNKIEDEIRFKIKHLEQSLEVVREKNSKQFIKGQIVALNEIRCSIERNDWACDRGEYYVGW